MGKSEDGDLGGQGEYSEEAAGIGQATLEEEFGDEAVDGRGGERPRGLDPDSILDTLVPESIDWRSTVRRFPGLSVAGVALVGYVVGRTKGGVIISGLTAALSSAMMRQLSDVFDGEFFDF